MPAEILVRYLHFISIFTLVGTLVGEHLLLKDQMTRSEIHRMSLLDSIYGLSAILVVTAGLILWFGVGKPAIFYSQNWIFYLKVGLVVLLGLLSIPPTIFFIKNRKGALRDEVVVVPKYIKILIRIELALLLFIPLCAAFMAKGVGYMD